MYEAFYALSGSPFQLTPDSRFYFGSREHRKAMAFLEFGIAQREGFVVITGEVGAGKTTLVEHLLSTLDRQQYAIARIVTTSLGGFDALCMIGSAFGLYKDGMSKPALIGRFSDFFSQLQQQQKYPLIIIDEAQSLTIEAVEEFRMLSNLVSGFSAPFQGILLGQPEFRAKLSQPELEQFRQRVIASCHLSGLGEEDTRKYIEYRLARVGWRDDPRIADDAFVEIHYRSGGIPRRINTLCSRLLLLGYLEERHDIDRSKVAAVAAEMAAEVGPLGNAQVPLAATEPGRRLEHREADVLGLPEPAEERGHYAEPERMNRTHISNGLTSRVRRLEQQTDKHSRTIVRALELALEFMSVKQNQIERSRSSE